MNRRTFFMGTGAIACAAVAPNLRGITLAAQTPMYQGEVIYEFTDFAGPTWDWSTDGRVDGVSRDGLIVGRDRVEGRMVPCSWDLTGARTVLDTGALEFDSWDHMRISPGGQLAGTFLGVSGDSASARAVSWASGSIELLPADEGIRTWVSFINDAGVISGVAYGLTSRWTKAGLETLPLPEGSTFASARFLDQSGIVYGTYVDQMLGLVADPWRWNADGSVDSITLPDELTAVRAVTTLGAQTGVPIVFDNGDFMLTSAWRVGDVSTAGSWLNAGGQYSPLMNGEAPADFLAETAESPERIAGSTIAGSPAFWENGMVTRYEDVSTLPESVDLAGITGFATDGRIVAESSSLEQAPKIVLLHPM